MWTDTRWDCEDEFDRQKEEVVRGMGAIANDRVADCGYTRALDLGFVRLRPILWFGKPTLRF